MFLNQHMTIIYTQTCIYRSFPSFFPSIHPWPLIGGSGMNSWFDI